MNTTCMPEPLGSCVPSYVPPHQAKGACTAADVMTFYNNCITGGVSCDGSGLSSAACFNCLASQSTSSSWGAVVFYDNNALLAVNVGGCYALLGASAACATATEEQSECEIAACGGACYSSTSAQWDACIAAADMGECATYVTASNANCPLSITMAPECSLSPDGGIEPGYLAVAKEFCE
jgi:hypothetical protein